MSRIGWMRVPAILVLALFAFPPKPAKAQYTIRQCADLAEQINAAHAERAYERLVSLSREHLTYCKKFITTEIYVTALERLNAGLLGTHQHSEALAVANQCLQINSANFGCTFDKAIALFYLKRPQEAKEAVERGLRYPAITEVDVKLKKILTSLRGEIDHLLQNQPTQPEKRKTAGYGSGFFVSNAGHIVTNSHVAKNCGSLTTADGTALKFIRSNDSVDLALLQATGINPPAVATFRQTDAALGESVVVFGFPLTGVLSTGGNVTTGTVSAITGIRDNPHNLQITAPIQPGNSGGPLLDQSGNVIGVVVAKLDAVKTASIIGDVPQNVNFAIKGREIIAFLNQSNIAPTISSTPHPLATETVAASAVSFTLRIACRQ
jgi:S1-C subfamily serine protease